MLAACRKSWLAVGAAGLLSGCAANVGALVAELDGRQAAVELDDVPFHSQVTDQCGPASLASILEASGADVTPVELRSRVYIPGRQGSLQIELLAATRAYGRIPYEIDPTLAALLAELDAGRPVLVLQNLGLAIAPIWHYAVVVGYLPDERQFVLRSGSSPRALAGIRSFAASWERGSLWGFVAVKPGDLPARPDPGRYLRAVAAFETTGDGGAMPAYRAATEQWPENRLSWLGLGNAAYAQESFRIAAAAYGRALEADPEDPIVLNNLSQVYLRLGCREQALATIDAALAVIDASNPVRPQLLDSRDEVLRGPAGTDCR